jgi:DNA-binding MarR family transcriptional regulator
MKPAAAPGGATPDWADVAAAMDRALRAFGDRARPLLQASGAADVSPQAALFLVSLGRSEMTVAEICRAGRYVGSNASYLLKSLQEAGYIARRADDRDRRNAIVGLTERGIAVVASLRAALGPCPAGAMETVLGFERRCGG